MKLLGTKPVMKPVTAEGSLINNLPKKQVTVEPVVDSAGTGAWFQGRVLFISDEEVVIVPMRCKATTIYGGISRMPRSAKTGLPKKQRRGNDKRIHSVLVELVEYAKPRR